ncbi:MAG: hypothetical protein QW348_08615 [Ignisphaera sp.]
MRRLLIISKPVNYSLSDVLPIIGVDRKTHVIIVSPGSQSTSGFRDSIDSELGIARAAKTVADAVNSQAFHKITFALTDADPLTATTIFALYIAFNTIESFTNIYVEPLKLVYNGEVLEFAPRMRLCIDRRDILLLKAVERCADSERISGIAQLPSSSTRRRLLKLYRNGFVEVDRLGRRYLYCPTQLSQMFREIADIVAVGASSI